MKKSVVVPTRSVQEKHSGKPSFPNMEKEKPTPFRKPDTPVNHSIRPASPNAHDPVDNEFPIPIPDKEAGKYTPSQDPW